MDNQPTISFLVPCYDEAETIPEFYRRASAVAGSHPAYRFEFVFINDGSRDDTPALLDGLAKRDPRVKVLHFARNRGHQIAITAGLDFAVGDIAVIIDGDLQDPPEVVSEMIARIEDGFDVVHAQRRTRKGESWFKLATANWFYRLLSRLSGENIIENCGDFRAITRPVVETIRGFREPHRFMRGVFSALGFRQCVIQYDRDARFAGQTKYTLRKMAKLAFNAVLTFSTIPLQFITYASMAMWSISLLFLIKSLYEWFMGKTVIGWTSLVCLISFYTGIIIFSLAIVASYIGRIFEQGQGRPLYWLSDIRNIEIDRQMKRSLVPPEILLYYELNRARGRWGAPLAPAGRRASDTGDHERREP